MKTTIVHVLAVWLILGIQWGLADDKETTVSEKFSKRQNDWRQRQIVYQIFVDRFDRGRDVHQRQHLYPAPRKLMEWQCQPRPGKQLKGFGCWSHELEFWGGDLLGVTARLPLLRKLGINTIYLNPIFHALTNHKYDAIDYFAIDPQFGTIDDLRTLAENAHRLGIKIVLDGVFNHVGVKSKWFQEVKKASGHPHREFFCFNDSALGYRAWANVPNLPELNLESPALQKILFGDSDSVVRRYLQIVDGWRLDVAFEIGPKFLRRITDAAHAAKPGSLVVGEIWSYPDGWLRVMDGVMNFHLRQLILDAVRGEIAPGAVGRHIERMVADATIESVLQSWIILSNHDTPRLKTLLPDESDRKLALLLQFTLPGAPVIYYGEEIGMNGGEDPANRGPMQWQRYDKPNKDLQLYQKLIAMRQRLVALQYGDYGSLDSERTLAFYRCTDKIDDLVIVVANLGAKPVKETLVVPEYRLMNWAKLHDQWGGKATATIFCGMIKLEIPAKSFRVFTPAIDRTGYSPYKRVR